MDPHPLFVQEMVNATIRIHVNAWASILAFIMNKFWKKAMPKI
jgi:hypothetical protein